MSRRAPSLFVCYRRADEPFAAALTASVLEDIVGEDGVFLDTLYLANVDRSSARSSMPSEVAGPCWR